MKETCVGGEVEAQGDCQNQAKARYNWRNPGGQSWTGADHSTAL